MCGAEKTVYKRIHTTVVVEHLGEAMENSISTATVGAALLNPLSMRDNATVPAHTSKYVPYITNLRKNKRRPQITELSLYSPVNKASAYLTRSSYSQLRPLKCLGQAQKLPSMHLPPFLQQSRLCLAPAKRHDHKTVSSPSWCWYTENNGLWRLWQ